MDITKIIDDHIQSLEVSEKYIIVALERSGILYYDYSGTLVNSRKLDDHKIVVSAASNSKQVVLYVRQERDGNDLKDVVNDLVLSSNVDEIDKAKYWIEYLPNEAESKYE